MSAIRTGEPPAAPRVILAGNVFDARRHVREAAAELKERPGYHAAVKLQLLERRWRELRHPKLV